MAVLTVSVISRYCYSFIAKTKERKKIVFFHAIFYVPFMYFNSRFLHISIIRYILRLTLNLILWILECALLNRFCIVKLMIGFLIQIIFCGYNSFHLKNKVLLGFANKTFVIISLTCYLCFIPWAHFHSMTQQILQFKSKFVDLMYFQLEYLLKMIRHSLR